MDIYLHNLGHDGNGYKHNYRLFSKYALFSSHYDIVWIGYEYGYEYNQTMRDLGKCR